LCTEAIGRVVGQRKMTQGHQMQVSDDSDPGLHLVLAESERALQFLHQDFDCPTRFVDHQNLPRVEVRGIGGDGQDVLPAVARAFREDVRTPPLRGSRPSTWAMCTHRARPPLRFIRTRRRRCFSVPGPRSASDRLRWRPLSRSRLRFLAATLNYVNPRFSQTLVTFGQR